MTITERLTATQGALLVVDLQVKLLEAIADRESVVANAVRLVRGAAVLGMPVLATEQYPKGLGVTASELVALIPERWPKTAFHCCAVPQLLERLYGRNVRHVTLTGIEAHVCVAQTALELMNLGFRVQVVADAVASRHRLDWDFALRRLERVGVVISTTEAVLFEWVEKSDRPEFKTISELIKAGDRSQKSAGTL